MEINKQDFTLHRGGGPGGKTSSLKKTSCLKKDAGAERGGGRQRKKKENSSGIESKLLIPRKKGAKTNKETQKKQKLVICKMRGKSGFRKKKKHADETVDLKNCLHEGGSTGKGGKKKKGLKAF